MTITPPGAGERGLLPWAKPKEAGASTPEPIAELASPRPVAYQLPVVDLAGSSVGGAGGSGRLWRKVVLPIGRVSHGSRVLDSRSSGAFILAHLYPSPQDVGKHRMLHDAVGVGSGPHRARLSRMLYLDFGEFTFHALR